MKVFSFVLCYVLIIICEDEKSLDDVHKIQNIFKEVKTNKNNNIA